MSKMKKMSLAEIKKRVYYPNLTARKFCWDNGLIIFPSCQAGTNKVKIFRQRKNRFIAISEKLYDQSVEKEVLQYHADIDAEYERIYLKMKDKV